MGKKLHHIIGNNSISNKTVAYKNNILQKNKSVLIIPSKNRFNIFRYFCLSYKIKPEKQNQQYENSCSIIIENEYEDEIKH